MKKKMPKISLHCHIKLIFCVLVTLTSHSSKVETPALPDGREVDHMNLHGVPAVLYGLSRPVLAGGPGGERGGAQHQPRHQTVRTHTPQLTLPKQRLSTDHNG